MIVIASLLTLVGGFILGRMYTKRLCAREIIIATKKAAELAVATTDEHYRKRIKPVKVDFTADPKRSEIQALNDAVLKMRPYLVASGLIKFKTRVEPTGNDTIRTIHYTELNLINV